MKQATPLKRLVDLVREAAAGRELPFVSLEHVESGTGHLLTRELPSRVGEQATMVTARPGDVLFGKLRPYLAKTHLAETEVHSASELLVLRPSPGLDARWLHYVVSSRPFVEWSVATSDGAKMPRTNWGALGEFRVTVPRANAQRAIADYLDTETARIDALIAKKKALSQGVNERLRATVSRSLGGDQPWRADALPLLPAAWEWIAARHVFPKVTVGVVVNPSHYFTEVGVPFIHGTDIRHSEIDQASLKYLSDEDSRGPLAKSRLQAGDVIAMRVGEPGRAAVVPSELEGANCASVIIFKRSDLLDPWLVAEFMNSSPGRAQVEMAQYGAAQGVLNVSDALTIRFPVPPPDVQRDLREQLGEARKGARTLIEKLSAQIALLEEHRQALITAAVTGEFEVPGVAA